MLTQYVEHSHKTTIIQGLLSVGHSLCSKVISHTRRGEAVGQIRCVTKDKQPQQPTTLPRRQGVCPNRS